MLKSYWSKSLCASILVLFSLAGASTSEAAKSSTKKSAILAKIPDNDNVPVPNDAEYEKLIAKAKPDSASRGLAEVDRIDYATAVADDLKNFIADLQGGTYWKDNKQTPKTGSSPTGVHSAADLAKLIDKYEGSYATLSPAAKIAAAQLIALKPYRGVLYRLRPIAEAQNTPAIHGMVISYLRALNAGLNNLYPTDQGQAAFDYFAKPFLKMPAQIKNEDQLYTFINNEALPAQLALVTRISQISLDTPVYLDNKIFWDKANFVSDKDRFQLVGNSEKLAYLSALCGNVSSIYSSLAYDWTDLFKATQGYWVVYGFNTTFSRPDNMTAQQRVAEIRSNPQLFTLRKGGEVLTSKSYEWFLSSLRAAKASWKLIRSEQNKGDSKTLTTFMDPQGFMPFARTINTSFANIDDLIKGKTVKDAQGKDVVVKRIGSAVVGSEFVDVDLEFLFKHPPEDLKAFLPIEPFEDGAHDKIDKETGLKYRNYSRGNPKTWDVGLYGRYFPGVKTNSDVKKTARVLSQSWGGSLLGFPFATVLF